MSWLKKPREFRLLEELNHTDGNISFGPKNNDITLTEWIGTMYLPKRDKIVSFDMTCTDDFPSAAPVIKFNVDVKSGVKLTTVCDKNGHPKSEYFNWDSNVSICDNLRSVHSALNNAS